MFSELYNLVVWVTGGFAWGVYVLEALGIYAQGLSLLDPILVGAGVYSAYRLAKDVPLGMARRVAAVGPVVLLAKHIFEVYPENPFTAVLSIAVTVAAAVGTYTILGTIVSKKPEAKVLPSELGEYPISLNENLNLYIPTKQISEHIQVIGKSGSGKSASYFLNAKNQVIKQGKGCFSFDSKSEELPVMSFYAQEAGRLADFVIFDFRFPERSYRINPLAWFKKDTDGNTIPDADLVSNIARESIYFLVESKDDYYRNIGREFIRNSTILLLMEVPIITYKDYFYLVATEIETFETISQLCDRHPTTDQAQYFQNQWLNLSNSERRKVLSGLLNLLAPFVNGPWAPLINTTKPDFLISEIVQKNKIFHFGAASLVYPSDYRKISATFLMGLMGEVGRRALQPQRVPFDIFLDEFSSIAYPGFADVVETVRSSDIGVHLGHQSLGDLTRAGGESFREAILDSTTTKIFFRLLSDETADRCAKIIGTRTAESYMVKSVKTNAGIFGGHQEAGATIKERDKEFIVPPDDFKNFHKGQAAVVVTYNSGIVRQVIQFPMAPMPPAIFDFTEVLGTRNHHKGPVETNLPFKKPVVVAKPAEGSDNQDKPIFMRDPLFAQELEDRKKTNEKKGKPQKDS